MPACGQLHFTLDRWVEGTHSGRMSDLSRSATSEEGLPTEEPCPEGISVVVEARWLKEHSSPHKNRYAFAYTVTITNHGRDQATLVARHWEIRDGESKVEHVRGPGVVGYQPALQPGQSFTYTSGAVLESPYGTMQGEYLLVRPDGTRFETAIAPFALVCPEAVQ
mgnify:CR=1 FL=1